MSSLEAEIARLTGIIERQRVLLEGAADEITRRREHMNEIVDPLLHADAEGTLTYANPAAMKLFGTVLKGMTLHDIVFGRLVEPENIRNEGSNADRPPVPPIAKRLWIALQIMQAKDPSYRSVMKERVELRIPATPTSPEQSYDMRIVMRWSQDASRIHVMLTDIQDIIRDGVTGLLPRSTFDNVMKREFSRRRDDATPISLIMVDIDHLKRFNDAYGHQVGDQVLRRVSAAVQKVAIRQTDLVARYGGEEIAVILPDTDLAGACAVAERIRAAVEDIVISFRVNPGKAPTTVPVTVSLGVAATVPGVDAAELIRRADKALYSAKEAGRNRVAYSDTASVAA